MIKTERDRWDFLLHKTKLYAANHVARWHWRGKLGGILPDGFDPDSIASQAILELLQHSSAGAAPIFPDTDQLQRDLERRVRRHVNRLHHHRENRLLRNEPDLAPRILDDGELISPINLIPDRSPTPDNALIEKESLANFEAAKARFSANLPAESGLKTMFDLFCDDVHRPDALSRRMNLPVSSIQNLRKQLRRRCRSTMWRQASRLP